MSTLLKKADRHPDVHIGHHQKEGLVIDDLVLQTTHVGAAEDLGRVHCCHDDLKERSGIINHSTMETAPEATKKEHLWHKPHPSHKLFHNKAQGHPQFPQSHPRSIRTTC